MAAIVRVKRKRCEDPAEALLLACKKRKDNEREQSESSTDPEITELLKFAGTVSSREGNVSTQIRAAIRKEKLQKEYKQHSVDHTDIAHRTRAQVKASSGRNRYKVIASHRAIELDHLDETNKGIVSPLRDCSGDAAKVNEATTLDACTGDCSPTSNEAASGSYTPPTIAENGDGESQTAKASTTEKLFCLYDVEHDAVNVRSQVQQVPPSSDLSEITCNSVPLVREHVQSPQHAAAQVDVVPTDPSEFVYDLYYTNRRDLDFRWLEGTLRIEAYGDDVMYDDYRDPTEEEVYEDDDDSNDEGNWRNDYPDEDPHFIENAEAEYDYTEDMNQNHLFIEEEDNLEDYLSSRCNLEDGGELSSDEDVPVYSQPLPRQLAPTRSYETYYREMKEQLDKSTCEDDT